MATATVRDLRTRFPRIKELVAQDGEVLVTDHGRPLLVLRPYVASTRRKPVAVDYWDRLKRRQPRALSRGARRALGEADRGER
ncbi:MAG: type II toxin-antitoxin system Phd/YefM family antitoxin [Candidatus Binatia bacterium]